MAQVSYSSSSHDSTGSSEPFARKPSNSVAMSSRRTPTGASASKGSSSGEKKTIFEPEWSRMYPTSSALSRVFIATITPPACSTPKWPSSSGSELKARNATLSSFCRPARLARERRHVGPQGALEDHRRAPAVLLTVARGHGGTGALPPPSPEQHAHGPRPHQRLVAQHDHGSRNLPWEGLEAHPEGGGL